jgi:hypothetical protein
LLRIHVWSLPRRLSPAPFFDWHWLTANCYPCMVSDRVSLLFSTSARRPATLRARCSCSRMVSTCPSRRARTATFTTARTPAQIRASFHDLLVATALVTNLHVSRPISSFVTYSHRYAELGRRTHGVSHRVRTGDDGLPPRHPASCATLNSVHEMLWGKAASTCPWRAQVPGLIGDLGL